MSATFEGTIKSTMGKKTKRMKWKITLKQVNKTDTSLKVDATMDGKPKKVDLLIHANTNKTVDVNGYVLNGKKRKAITVKNMQLTENAMKEQIAKIQ